MSSLATLGARRGSGVGAGCEPSVSIFSNVGVKLPKGRASHATLSLSSARRFPSGRAYDSASSGAAGALGSPPPS